MSITLSSYSACLGTVLIDWVNRKVEFCGMDGTGSVETTVDDVCAAFNEHSNTPDVEVMGLIFWLDNEQLSVHDASSFADEVAKDEELDEEDED